MEYRRYFSIDTTFTWEDLFPFMINECVKNQIFSIMKLQIDML